MSNAALKEKKQASPGAIIIKPFISATIDSISQLGEVDSISCGKPFIQRGGVCQKADISGVIAIISDTFKGSIYISFPEKTFLNLVNVMLGEEYKEINEEIQDAASEIANIIFGNAKKELGEMGIKCEFTLPIVLTGAGHSVHVNEQMQIVVVPFSGGLGEFYLQICQPKETP